MNARNYEPRDLAGKTPLLCDCNIYRCKLFVTLSRKAACIFHLQQRRFQYVTLNGDKFLKARTERKRGNRAVFYRDTAIFMRGRSSAPIMVYFESSERHDRALCIGVTALCNLFG